MNEEENEGHPDTGNGRSSHDSDLEGDEALTKFRFTADIVFEALDLVHALGMISHHFLRVALESHAGEEPEERPSWFAGELMMGPVDDPRWEAESPE